MDKKNSEETKKTKYSRFCLVVSGNNCIFAEGMAEGIRQIADNMKKSGMSLEQIHAFTGLPIEEIEKL